MKIGFYPRLFLDGRVVSGAGSIIYNDKVLLTSGFSPKPLNATTIAALGTALGHRGDHVYAFGLNGENIRRIITSPYGNCWGAGADQFSAAVPGEIAVEYDQITGVRGSIREYGGDNNDRQIVIDGKARTPRRASGGHAVLNLRLFGGMAVWRQWSGKDAADSGISGIRDYANGSAVVNLRSLAGEWEGSPVPFRIGTEDWFAFATNTDIRLRPWDSPMGYIVATGENRNLNLDAMGLGVLARLVYHDNNGVGELRDIDTRNPRTDVRVRAGSVTPPPPTPEVPVPVEWPLAPNRKSVVEAVISEHPEIDFVDETDRKRGLPIIVHRLNKPGENKPWGLKGKAKYDATKPLPDYNTDAINFLRPDDFMEIVDVFANGKAAWLTAKSKTPTKQGTNGWWIPAPPAAAPPPPEKPLTGITDAQFATLERVRAQYPPTGLSPGEIGAILNEVAWVHKGEGVGLQTQPTGDGFATQPRTGTQVWNGLRFIVDGKHIAQDVLRSAGTGTATPTHGALSAADPASFVHPVEPIFTETPPVVVPPPPPTPIPVPVPGEEPDMAGAILNAMLVMADTLQKVVERLDAIKADADADAADLGLTHAAVVAIDAQLKRGFKSRYFGDITPK